MKQLGFFLLFFVFIQTAAEAAVRRSQTVGRKAKSSVSLREVPTEGLAMRKERRMAIGTAVGGALGFLGAELELNLNSRTGILGGYGGGPGYQAYTIQLKQYLAGDSFLPFLGAGYSRWFNSKGSEDGFKESRPAFLVEKFLKESEKETGLFNVDLVYTTIGAQFVNLTGEWAGFSIFAEVMLMVDIEGLTAAPNGAVGMMYYF